MARTPRGRIDERVVEASVDDIKRQYLNTAQDFNTAMRLLDELSEILGVNDGENILGIARKRMYAHPGDVAKIRDELEIQKRVHETDKSYLMAENNRILQNVRKALGIGQSISIFQTIELLRGDLAKAVAARELAVRQREALQDENRSLKAAVALQKRLLHSHCRDDADYEVFVAALARAIVEGAGLGASVFGKDTGFAKGGIV